MFQLILGACIISFSPVFVKLAAPYGISGDAAAFHRVLIGGVCLFLASLTSREPRSKVWNMPRSGFNWSLACAAFFTADLLCWHLSILYLGPGLATLFGNFQVFLLAAWGIVFLREKPGLRFFAGIALAMGGLFAIVAPAWTSAGHDFQLGVIFGLATGVFYAGFILTLNRSLAECGDGSQLAAMTTNSLLTAAMLVPVCLLRGESLALDFGMPLLLMTAYGISSQFVGWVLISRGLRETRTSLVGLILLLQPCLAYVWDLTIFSRPAGLAEILGVAATLTGIALGARRR
ncbi:MAG: DMT family transporter [Humidesulfovibrio sp.]|uniref:DMT family transporter n=1 Tax=Humidesulfovibrio sp. TaxID=2910988 RepID=UPI0027EE6808|nr:DMT family transporter [Humidesulfovibrio sp.]MDQ7835422.1 DMT family transporter [Humidesulfovibrio sp.]